MRRTPSLFSYLKEGEQRLGKDMPIGKAKRRGEKLSLSLSLFPFNADGTPPDRRDVPSTTKRLLIRWDTTGTWPTTTA